MPTYKIQDKVACYITYNAEVEAESEAEAREKFRNGDYFEIGSDIGDAVEGVPQECLITELKNGN